MEYVLAAVEQWFGSNKQRYRQTFRDFVFRFLFIFSCFFLFLKKILFLFHSPTLWIIIEVAGPAVFEKTKQTNPLTFEYIIAITLYCTRFI
jgi:hypothetical protein